MSPAAAVQQSSAVQQQSSVQQQRSAAQTSADRDVDAEMTFDDDADTLVPSVDKFGTMRGCTFYAASSTAAEEAGAGGSSSSVPAAAFDSSDLPDADPPPPSTPTSSASASASTSTSTSTSTSFTSTSSTSTAVPHPSPSPSTPAQPPTTADDEEAAHLHAASVHKASGNTLFTTGHYLAAIDAYRLALTHTPPRLPRDTAILHSNLAACFLKPAPEVVDFARALEHAEEAVRCRPGWARARIRRVRACAGVGGWKELERAEAEVKGLLAGVAPGTVGVGAAQGAGAGTGAAQGGAESADRIHLEAPLTPAERKECERLLADVRAKLELVKKREVAEALGGLRQLGDGLLRPFGLSTGDFAAVRDEKTGAYSLSFNRGGGQ